MEKDKPKDSSSSNEEYQGSSFLSESETIQADSNVVLSEIIESVEEQGFLVVLAGKSIGRAFPLNTLETRIGRENSADIYIRDNTVSRSHAIIRRKENGEYWVEDLGSKAGTFINGNRLEQPSRLYEGDRLQIGMSTVYKLLYSSRQRSDADLVNQDELRRELEAARRIQLGMVPPALKVLETPLALITGILKPATFAAGDFWTYIDGESHLLLLVADVTGHGAGPAMMTTVAKSCLDTVLLSPAGALSLENVLGTMNQVILGISKGSLAMTAFVALIDASRQVVSYAVAGHVPQLLLRREGEQTVVIPLTGLSTPLGEQARLDLSFGEQPYAPGDRLALFTDGLVETCDATGGMYNIRRLRRFLQANNHLTILELLETTLEEVESPDDEHPAEDDITLVMVELR